MVILFFLTYLILILTQASGADVDPELPFSGYLDSDSKVLLRWGFDVAKDTILFELRVNTTGWIGFGFSPSGGMAGSDIVIGGVGPAGLYFMDMNAVGNSMPLLDPEQDYKIVFMTEANGQTVMKFQRSISACNKNDFPITSPLTHIAPLEVDIALVALDKFSNFGETFTGCNSSIWDADLHQDAKLSVLKSEGTGMVAIRNYAKAHKVPIKLIYAYGETDDISYHKTQRGTKEVNLLKYMPRASVPDNKYIDLTMKNFTVPQLSTYYHCKVMEIPALDRKYHIYRIEPIIENKDIVHHLLLFRCRPSVNKPYEEQCYKSSNLECLQIVAAWGVGGGAFELPEVAGIPVGGEASFYRLEVHYNNYIKTAGRVDNSGLRLHYTAQLRQYDAGIVQTGLVATMGQSYAIPPNATAFHTYGLCDTNYIPEITSESTDMQVFAAILHTHLAGRKVRVGHFRDGKQIDFLAMNEHYDFEFQQVTHLGKTKAVKVGDKLVVECIYDTSNRTGLTWGGLGTTDEMCLAFLYYYPAMDFSSCVGLPNSQALMTEMGINKTHWIHMMETMNWDNKSITDYEEKLKRIQQKIIVANLNNMSIQAGMIPELRVPPSVNCLRSSSVIISPAKDVLLLFWLNLGLILYSSRANQTPRDHTV